MSKAIGMIEFKTTATGITAADAMVKTSEVEIVEAQTVCPGKYIAIITGDLSAVKAAVDAAVTTYEDKCIDSFVLGNPHESLFPAMYGTTQIEGISALGILETYDAALSSKQLTRQQNSNRRRYRITYCKRYVWKILHASYRRSFSSRSFHRKSKTARSIQGNVSGFFSNCSIRIRE